MRILRLAACAAPLLAASLAAAVTVSGHVSAPGGANAASVNLDFQTLAGVSIALANDLTDASGNYSVTVPADTYDINYKAPAGSGWASIEARAVVITTNTVRPNVTLPAGFLVQGVVKNAGGQVVANADLDFYATGTSDKWLTPGDATNGSGQYAVVVPAGTWDIGYDPPAGMALASVLMPGVVISAAVTRPLVTLPNAFSVGARVKDDLGAAVVDANTVFYDILGNHVRTANDHTNTTGDFAVFVVPGAYSIQVWGPAGSHLVAKTLTGILVAGNSALPDVTLASGRVVTGKVVATGGAALAGIDTDWTLPSGTVLTPNDNTDATGRYSVIVPDGTYLAGFDPPPGARYAARELVGVAIAADTSLPDVVLSAGRFVAGRVVDSRGAPAFDVNTSTLDHSTGVVMRTNEDHSDVNGQYLIVLSEGTYDVKYYPPTGSTLAPVRANNIVVSGADRSLVDVVLPDGVLLQGRTVNRFGQPVASANLNVHDVVTGAITPTQGDFSDANGHYGVRIPPATWNLEYIAPTPYLAVRVKGLSVLSDTTRPDVVMVDGSEADGDQDGINKPGDNCPAIANPLQADGDGDTVGDSCDDCRMVADSSQTDANANFLGDACEFTWGDIAPIGTYDGVVTVSDIVRALRLTVALEATTPELLLRANVAPATVAAGSPDVATPTMAAPKVVDVADVVLMLRVAVALSSFPTPT